MEKRDHIFISYAHEDEDVAAILYKRLKESGLNVWWDKKSLIPGEDWRIAIEKAIQQAQMVVILISKKSISKAGFYQKEISISLEYAEMQPEGAIFIVPLRIEECEVPYKLKPRHWLNLYEEDKISKWINSLKSQMGKDITNNFSVARVEFTYKNTVWRMDKYPLRCHNLLCPDGREVYETISVGETRSYDILPGHYSFYLEYAEWFLEPIHRSYYEKSMKTTSWEGKLLPGVTRFLIRKPEGFEFQNIGNNLSIASWPLTFFSLYKQRLILEYLDFQEWNNTKK